MNEDKGFTLDEVEISIIEYMETKYGQEFELVDIGYNSIISNEVNARVISLEDERKNEINVNWYYENGNESIEDNYTKLLYKKEVNNLMDPLVELSFNEYEYIAFSGVGDNVSIDVYDANVSFSNIAKNEIVVIDTDILLNENNISDEKTKENIYELYENLKNETTKDIHLNVTVYVCDKNNFYENQPLVQQFKELYSLNIDEIPLTFYKPDRIIIKSFHFTTYHLEDGVDVR